MFSYSSNGRNLAEVSWETHIWFFKILKLHFTNESVVKIEWISTSTFTVHESKEIDFTTDLRPHCFHYTLITLSSVKFESTLNVFAYMKWTTRVSRLHKYEYREEYEQSLYENIANIVTHLNHLAFFPSILKNIFSNDERTGTRKSVWKSHNG